ncbi:MAG: MBL fold metallo-hydrolase, partial [Candidatus Omnitrophota bacterium]
LWYLIPDRKDITVYICPGFKQEIKDRIVSFGVKVIEAGETTQIKDGIYSTGELYRESEGRKICEQSVVIKTGDGLAIICGCAHPGITNIVNSVKKQFNEDVYFIIGGLHLKDEPIEEAKQVIRKLKQSGVERIAPMHCTGKKATQLIKKEFNASCVEVQQGNSIEV